MTLWFWNDASAHRVFAEQSAEDARLAEQVASAAQGKEIIARKASEANLANFNRLSQIRSRQEKLPSRFRLMTLLQAEVSFGQGTMSTFSLRHRWFRSISSKLFQIVSFATCSSRQGLRLKMRRQRLSLIRMQRLVHLILQAPFLRHFM